MGKLNCSCFNNNEKGQILFDRNDNNDNVNINQNEIIEKESLF